jgi:hypothetical protein
MNSDKHRHEFRGATTISEMHTLYYSGSTTADRDLPGHVHYMSGATTCDDGHRHKFALSTGPEMEVGGGHTHYYAGMTSVDNGHVHYFSGYTSIHYDRNY